MKCECVLTQESYKVVKLCDAHRAFVDAATKEASREVWGGAIRVYEEVHEELLDLVAAKHQTAAHLGARLYREALQRKVKD